MKRSPLLLIFLAFLVFACGGQALPTLAPTATIPTPTPMPFRTLREVVEHVVGEQMEQGSLNIYTDRSYKNEIYPDGRIGYNVDFVIKDPRSHTREEMTGMLFSIAHEIYYNFSGGLPMYLYAIVRTREDDAFCPFSIGIGYQRVENYLPPQRPANFEAWFKQLQEPTNYYGDLPGQSQSLMAFANDPAQVPLCELREWK